MPPRTLSAFVALLIVSLLSLGTPAIAGPFSGMAGEWSGGGKLTTSEGSSERLRCRANNTVGSSGDTMNISIRCASDSYKIDLTGYVRNNNGTLSGQWSEPNYNSAGTLAGRVSGNRISAQAVGNTLSAGLSMSGSGNHMSVTIRPQGTSVQAVSLSFRKR